MRHTFFNQLSQVLNRFLLKIKSAKAQFLKSACSFYLGFIIGNLFGTFLDLLRNQMIWDGIILMMIIFFFEFLNFFIYHPKPARPPTGVPYQRGPAPTSSISKFPNPKRFIILKNLQIGILFGLFIDAFKVGS